MAPATTLNVASHSSPTLAKGTTMPRNLLLCPGSRTISSATALLALQGDMSDDEVVSVAMEATDFGAPHVKVWYDLVTKVADLRTMEQAVAA